MFIGHFAPALIAATQKKAPSLTLLFIAAQWVDWAFFTFLLFDIEKMNFKPGISVMNPMDLYHLPYTHSLVGCVAFAFGYAALVWLLMRTKAPSSANMAAIIAGGVVVSHWFLDFLVHIPDLTLMGDAPKLGLGLWNYPALAMPLELGIILGALWFYAKVKSPPMQRLWALGIVMLALQLFNWFGPVDTQVTPMTSALGFFAFGIITLFASWVEAKPKTNAP
jgi:hypothetical protein